MKCILEPCIDPGGTVVKVSEKGWSTIIKCSEIKEDGVKNAYMNGSVTEVHLKCRKTYTRNPQPPVTPSTSCERNKPPRSTFDFKSLCFLCGKKCIDVSKCRNSTKEIWFEARTIAFITTIREHALKRNDAWGQEVLVRLANKRDLIQADGRYHKYCYCRFKLSVSKPEEATGRGGSRADIERTAAFQKLCQHLEDNDECQYTLKELNDLFCKLNPDVEPYNENHLKKKLMEHYGDSIHATTITGVNVIMCFNETVSKILSDKWYENRFEDEAEEEKRIIETAAMLIRRDIKNQVYDCSHFPSFEEIQGGSVDLIPESLQLLISQIIKPKKQTKENKKVIERKMAAISHSIINATRPRSFLSPIQFGTAVYLHRRFGSRLLVDVLSKMGFCSSYNEVLKFERSVTSENDIRLEQGYIQFVFDNADYNAHTIDGHNTFHAMGGIMCVTPRTAVQIDSRVSRMSISAKTVEKRSLTQIEFYQRPSVSGYAKVEALPLQDLKVKNSSAVSSLTLNFLWSSGLWLSDDIIRPGWSGLMEKLYYHEPYEVSAVVALPFINHSPSNPSTIYTALLYAAEQAMENGQLFAIVSFDQQLYVKAREMVASAPSDSRLRSIVLRLGGFHLLLSFLGTIGFIMAGSGLEELWGLVYAKNSIIHMMNGKAYSRVIRALFLTEEALITIFLKQNDIFSKFKKSQELKAAYKDLVSGKSSVLEAVNSPIVNEFVELLEQELQRTKSLGRTQKLWINFIGMVEIVRLFIKAERSGDFFLHLHCLSKMLPYFHSTGHFNYAKSTHTYLQDCFQLLSDLSPDEYEKLITKGYFTIRRSDKFWAGVWSDMTIEQVLMRSMKSSGGLTSGRGISPSTIATWITSMPVCSRIVEAVEAFAGVEANTSDQHVELREANQKRNAKDIQIFVEWLCEHNPFSKNPSLSSLSTGVVADASVNCDEAYEIGVAAIKEIEGKKFSDIHLKRKHVVKSLASVTKSIPLRHDTVCVNPNQLLHRMVCTVRSSEQLAEIFQYELCTHPPSLFDDTGLMRKGSKSSIVKVLAPKSNELVISNENVDRVSIIVDGGHLLHRVVWQRPATFRTICEQYARYVIAHFGKCTIVFDGYEEPYNTKDEEHIRRSASITHVRVNVENDIQVTLSQEDFLSYSENKMQFISLLKSHLLAVGCHVLQGDGDADSLIVSTTLSKAQNTNAATLIGDDTDLLMLLTVLAPQDNKISMVAPGKKNEQDKCYNISTIQHHIGEMKDVLLAVYAFTGIDTVSSIYRKGKVTPFKKVKANKTLREKLLVFNDPNASPNEIAEAGEFFFTTMYGSDDKISLDKLRYQLYVKQIGKQPLHAQFSLASLPPTTAAAREHSKRVYHQIQQWFGVTKDPLKWGWKKYQDHLRPVTTAKAAAPEDLLYLISCCCTDDCDRHCECKRSGLRCSSMCIQCAGHGCNNSDSADEFCSDEDWVVPGPELLLELPDILEPPEHVDYDEG